MCVSVSLSLSFVHSSMNSVNTYLLLICYRQSPRHEGCEVKQDINAP